MTFVIILANNILTFLVIQIVILVFKSCNISNCNSYSLDTFRENLTYEMYADTRRSIVTLINRMINDLQIKGMYKEICL
jgi:hypothetical protein